MNGKKNSRPYSFSGKLTAKGTPEGKNSERKGSLPGRSQKKKTEDENREKRNRG